MLVKLLNEEGPPFVEGAEGIVGRLYLGYIGGLDEVEQEFNGRDGCFRPLGFVEKGQGERGDAVVEFFAV